MVSEVVLKCKRRLMWLQRNDLPWKCASVVMGFGTVDHLRDVVGLASGSELFGLALAILPWIPSRNQCHQWNMGVWLVYNPRFRSDELPRPRKQDLWRLAQIRK